MIQIDYRDARPIYEQIVEKFEFLILKQILEPDTQMPSVRQMAAELSINPNTIQRAYAVLESEGYIYSVRGKGNFVADSHALFAKKEQEWLEQLRVFLADGRELGITSEKCRDVMNQVFGLKDEDSKGGTEHD